MFWLCSTCQENDEDDSYEEENDEHESEDFDESESSEENKNEALADFQTRIRTLN